MNHINLSDSEEECDDSLSKDLRKKGGHIMGTTVTAGFIRKKKSSSRVSYLWTKDVVNQIREEINKLMYENVNN